MVGIVGFGLDGRWRKMKFKDIKVGDTVYIKTLIVIGGWNRTGKAFFIPRKVTKVTPKQFEVEGLRTKSRKEDGSPVGDGSWVYIEGDEFNQFYSSEPELVRDQSEEAKAYNDIVKKYNSVSSMARNLNLKGNELEKYSEQINAAFVALEAMGNN